MADLASTDGETPALDRLEARFRTASPVFREAISRTRKIFGQRWARRFEGTISRMLPTDEDVAAAVDGYSRFALDVLRLQLRFEVDREYAAKAYADVAAEVYANESYMTSCYLPGLLLSHFLWPHHYRQARFFESVFVEQMSRVDAALFYDVGVGTGYYSRMALMGSPLTQGIGYDVSPASKAYGERHVRAFGAGERYRVELQDISAKPVDPVDWLICVELLEHLENPTDFLRALRSTLRQGGKGFITAAVNAPNADHIYLYRSPEEVKLQLLEAGFAVEQYFSALAGEPKRWDLPVAEVVAFIVT